MKNKQQEISLLDWDGTLRKGYTLFDWVNYLTNKKLLDNLVFNSLEKSLNEFQSGLLTYTDLVLNTADIYAKSVAGIDESDLAIEAEIFTLNDSKLFPFVDNMMSFLHSKKIDIIVISGAPTLVLNAFSSQLKIDKVFGLDLEKTDNRIYNGNILNNHGLFDSKKKLVDKFITEGRKIILGIGNSKSDIPLLEHARKSFIIEPIAQISLPNTCLSNPEKILIEIKNLWEES